MTRDFFMNRTFLFLIAAFFCISSLAATGNIAGTVTDIDTSLPISGADVVLRRGGSQVIGSTTTAPNGTYSFLGINPGQYNVDASASGYQTATVGAKVNNGETTTANLALQSNPGAVTGTVIDANTLLPLESATVEANFNNIVIAATLTNASGNYTLSGLPPDTYEIHAHAADYQIGTSPAVVQAGATTTVNFALNTNPGTVAGTVIDAGSSLPIEGATVEANLNNVIIASTLTDVLGHYSIPDLAPGSYKMHAHATGYQMGISSTSVTAGHTTTVDFALENNPSTVQGQITNTLTSSPISGVFVILSQGGSFIAVRVTDNSGNYTIDTLSTGNYTLTLVARGYYRKSTDFSIGVGETLTVNLTLLPNSPPKNLTGTVINNRFLLQADRIHHIAWQPSQDPSVLYYRVYRNGVILSTISANDPLIYNDHNRNSNLTDTYSVDDVNATDNVSSSVSISLR